MTCPKCKSNDIHPYQSILYGYVWRCVGCGNYWSDVQQEKIDKLRAGLKRIIDNLGLGDCCPGCATPMYYKHESDCWVVKLLEE